MEQWPGFRCHLLAPGLECSRVMGRVGEGVRWGRGGWELRHLDHSGCPSMGICECLKPCRPCSLHLPSLPLCPLVPSRSSVRHTLYVLSTRFPPASPSRPSFPLRPGLSLLCARAHVCASSYARTCACPFADTSALCCLGGLLGAYGGNVRGCMGAGRADAGLCGVARWGGLAGGAGHL